MEELLVIFILPSMLSGYSCISIYVKTSKVEVNQIVSKTEESDKIYVQQIELTHKIDSLYKYTTMFNTNLKDGVSSTNEGIIYYKQRVSKVKLIIEAYEKIKEYDNVKFEKASTEYFTDYENKRKSFMKWQIEVMQNEVKLYYR